MWYVYIIRCSDNSLYTGVTTDVERRFREHKEGKVGAKYTKAKKPEKLVYSKEFTGRSEAQIEEARIKKLTKTAKEELVRTAV